MHSRSLVLLVIAFFLATCAQVGQINGGEKDQAGPVLINAMPTSGAVRFMGNTIELEFDERVKLDNVREHLLISPPLDVAPTVRIAGPKRISITLNAPLRANTTYSFMIGDAIKDLTEGNTASGLTHVISTGDHVDSLSIEGVVSNSFTGKPESNILVMVYDPADTNTIRRGRPLYATRTKENGSFQLDHLHPGTYALYALRDQNANYRLDLPNESVAFLANTIELTPATLNDSVPQYVLHTFTERSAVQVVRESKVIPDGALRVILARPAQTLQLKDVARIGAALTWQQEWNATRDSILFWPSDTTDLLSGLYQLKGDTILDTLRYRALKPIPFFTGLTSNIIETADSAVLVLKASRPIKQFDPERITVIHDSLTVPFVASRSETNDRTIHVSVGLAKGANARVTVLPKAVIDIYNGHNDTLITPLGRAAEKSTGTLRVNIERDSTDHTPLIVQLLNAQELTVRESTATYVNPIVWERLQPGKYTLRTIEDRNENGRWDTGVVDQREQPETIHFHTEPINVRTAWDLGVDIVLE